MIRGIVASLSLLVSGSSLSLDDFDLAKYGPDDKISITRSEFIVKFITYKTRRELTTTFEEISGKELEEGGIRGFAVSSKEDDVCYVHIQPAKIWDDREDMAILGHEIYHCALAEHEDIFGEESEEEEEEKAVKEEPIKEEGEKDIEDLYAEDRRLELEWLKEDYENMGIAIDNE